VNREGAGEGTGTCPPPQQGTRARVRLRAELRLLPRGSGPAWPPLPQPYLQPLGRVLILSLFPPAAPGPCTQPRTSWKTSATCSTTWPTSWTRCWTEACSLLPLPASGCSASAPRDGGRADPAPNGASGSPQQPPCPHCALRLGTQPPLRALPGSVSHVPARLWAGFRGGQAFPTSPAAGGEPRGAAHAVPEATEKPSLPCTEPRSLHKGPFSFLAALPSPASNYLSPANNVSQERPPWAAATALAIY